MTQEDRIKLLDNFAAHALQALITKMPFLDLEGKEGKKVTTEEMKEIKQDITKSAYEYASYMLISRDHSIGWVEENEGFFNQTKKDPLAKQ